jgi:hypothetical protein
MSPTDPYIVTMEGEPKPVGQRIWSALWWFAYLYPVITLLMLLWPILIPIGLLWCVAQPFSRPSSAPTIPHRIVCLSIYGIILGVTMVVMWCDPISAIAWFAD